MAYSTRAVSGCSVDVATMSAPQLSDVTLALAEHGLASDRAVRNAPTSRPHETAAQALVDIVAYRLRALAQPMRIRVVYRLAEGSATVQELADALDVVQQNVSQHLAILHRAGVVSRLREGSRVRYELVDRQVLAVFEQVAAGALRHAEDVVHQLDPERSAALRSG